MDICIRSLHTNITYTLHGAGTAEGEAVRIAQPADRTAAAHQFTELCGQQLHLLRSTDM